MTDARQRGQSTVSLLIGVGVAIAVGLAVALNMPGPACVDGSSSHSIGRQGACSHHGGLSGGSGWLGLPAGLFAGLLTAILADTVLDPLAEKKEAARLACPARKRSVDGNDKEAVLRAAMLSSSEVEFSYQIGGISEQRRVLPRWLKMAIVEGDETLCLMANEAPTERQQPFALARISDLKIVRAVESEPRQS